MNVYELEKRTTPGPLHLSEPTDSGSMSLVGQHESEEVCHTYGNPEELLLLAHCRNHFMEALAALKLALSWMHPDREVEGRVLDKTITKLEEVK